MKTRIITGLVAGALFLPIVYMGGKPFFLLICAMAVIALSELIKMRKMSLFSVPSVIAFLTMLSIVASEHFEATLVYFDPQSAVYLGITLILAYTVFSKNKFTFEDAGFLTVSTMYVGISFFFFNEIRVIGLEELLLVLFLIWASDIGAYFSGRALGKHKLWPEISPNKTVEGFVGGILLAVVVSLVFGHINSNGANSMGQSIAWFACLGVVVAVLGTLGDLVQSAYKRHYGVKDAGNILPGHGGILDRFDSLLFTLPILFILNIF